LAEDPNGSGANTVKYVKRGAQMAQGKDSLRRKMCINFLGIK